MTQQELIQHEQDKQEILSVKNIQERYFKNSHSDVYNRITNWSEKFIDCNFSTKVVWFLLDKKEFPLCKICGNEIRKSITWWQYKQFPERAELCSKKCSCINSAKKRKEYCLEHFGVPNVSCIKSVKEKKAETCKEHFGVENPSQVPEIQNKKKVTNLERYGSENASQSKIVKEKIRKTNISNFGVDNPMKCEEVKEKVKATNRERFGSDWFLGTKECIQKTRETCREKYKVEWVSDIESVKNAASQRMKNLSQDEILSRIASSYESGDLKDEES